MREILFRGKSKDNDEWIEGDLLQYLAAGKMQIVRHCLGAGGVEIITETVGQYTGLKDKNGKKIFEGDIIKSTISDRIYVIIYSDKNFGFRGVTQTGEKGSIRHYASLEMCNKTYDVIGNIHDNPELLNW